MLSDNVAEVKSLSTPVSVIEVVPSLDKKNPWTESRRLILQELALPVDLVAEAESSAVGDPCRVLHLLIRVGACTETQLADVMATQVGWRRAGAGDMDAAGALATSWLKLAALGTRLSVSTQYLGEQRCAPALLSEQLATVLVDHIFAPERAEALRFALGRPVEFLIATPTELDGVLKQFGVDVAERADTTTDDGVLQLEALDHTLLADEQLADAASDAPAIRFVQRLIAEAMSRSASDIHIEPMEHRISVRIRIDGVLQDVLAPSVLLARAIVSRVKILAGLNIAEQRLPQDGRIRLRVAGQLTDFRVSTSPTMYGESVVLRILDRRDVTLEFVALGVASDHVAMFERALARPYGIALVTGPTGSGKTTTLYAALKHLNSRDRKILTVEDPVEYTLDGVNQTQVKPQIDYGFAQALRAFLRQDPDVLMVGEIRDRETADVAIQAALTGHLLLSTLHTNTAAAAITRLLEMGVEDFLLTSTLSLVVGQRLVRQVCAECAAPVAVAADLQRRFPTLEGVASIRQARGCAHCAGSGYRGRTVICEMLEMSDAIQALVLQRADAQTIERAAVAQGMRTLLGDGLRLVRQGTTTLEEVLRVTRAAS